MLSAREQHQWDELVGRGRPPAWCPWRARPSWSRRWRVIAIVLVVVGWVLALAGGARDDLVLGAVGMILVVLVVVTIVPLMFQDRPAQEPGRRHPHQGVPRPPRLTS